MSNLWGKSLFIMMIVAVVNSYPISSDLSCSLCPPGSHVKRACSVRSNTTCQLCRTGTFSDTPTDLKTCAICSVCPEGVYVNKPCTIYSDTVCSRSPPEKSDYYVISRDNIDPQALGVDLHVPVIKFDPSNDATPSSGELKDDDIDTRNHIKSYIGKHFITGKYFNYVQQKEKMGKGSFVNNKYVHLKITRNRKYKNGFHKNDNNIGIAAGKYIWEIAMTDIPEEKRSDNIITDQEKGGEDEFEKSRNKLDDATDVEINDRERRDVEDIRKTWAESEIADSINEDVNKKEADGDINEDKGSVYSEGNNNYKEDKHENEDKKNNIVVGSSNAVLDDRVEGDEIIGDRDYSTTPDDISQYSDVDNVNGGKDVSVLSTESTNQITLSQLGSETDVEDRDKVHGRLESVNEDKFSSSLLKDGNTRNNNHEGSDRAASENDANSELADFPANGNADLETVNREEKTIGQNNGSQPTIEQFDEVVENKEFEHNKDSVNEDTTKTAQMNSTEELQKNDSVQSPTKLTGRENSFNEEGRFDAVKSSVEESEINVSENVTSQLPDDSPAAKLVDHNSNINQNGHSDNEYIDVNTVLPTETSYEDVTEMELQTTEQPNKLPEPGKETSKHGVPVQAAVNKDGVRKVGRAQGKKNEDPEDKRRAAIILSVSAGSVAFVTLIFLVTRCWKKRKGHFKEMKKVNNIEEESVQPRPVNESMRDHHDEPSALSTKGHYRKVPDVSPPNTNIPQSDQEIQTETASAVAPLLTQHPPNEDLSEPESSPVQEPLLTAMDKLKYIDDSTDDEYVNLQSALMTAYRLSKVAEETPPTSPSFKQ